MKYSKMEVRDGRLVEVESREITQGQIKACPHLIFAGDHYRKDGSCKCDDPNNTVMIEWGYVWKDGRWRGA